MKNNSLAKFVRKVTTFTSSRKSFLKYQFNQAEDGKYYEYAAYEKFYISNLKIGDRIYIAKLRHNSHTKDYIWDVYEIELATYICSRTQEESQIPQLHFGNMTNIIKLKQNRINKK